MSKTDLNVSQNRPVYVTKEMYHLTNDTIKQLDQRGKMTEGALLISVRYTCQKETYIYHTIDLYKSQKRPIITQKKTVKRLDQRGVKAKGTLDICAQ